MMPKTWAAEGGEDNAACAKPQGVDPRRVTEANRRNTRRWRTAARGRRESSPPEGVGADARRPPDGPAARDVLGEGHAEATMQASARASSPGDSRSCGKHPKESIAPPGLLSHLQWDSLISKNGPGERGRALALSAMATARPRSPGRRANSTLVSKTYPDTDKQ